MPAEIGNQWWKLRSKHGRDKLFKTPELLWEAACEYFEYCLNNPLFETVVQKVKISKDKEKIELVKVPHTRPFTLKELYLYLDCNHNYFNDFQKGLINKEDKLSKDFSVIITRIQETVYSQKFAGAACGFYNANLISRDLGLKDNSDVTINKVNIEEIEMPKLRDDQER